MKPNLIFAVLTACLLCADLNGQNCRFETRVPDELMRKRYNPGGMWYGNPYTMFNKRTPSWNLTSALATLRSTIKSGTSINNGITFNNPISKLYYDILRDAKGATPPECNYNTQCAHASWTKNNALMALVGIDTVKSGNIITFEDMTAPDIEYYNWRAREGLRNLNPEVQTCALGFDCSDVHEVAFNLMEYLKAYDLMKTSGYIAPNDDDANGVDCDPRNKLREFAKNMYVESNMIINNPFGWKKNHGIICASALGMASIVLNDAGVETNWGTGLFGWLWGEGFVWPRPNYSPENWQKRAHGVGWLEDGLEDNFFNGEHWFPTIDVPMTSPDGKAGYAEGPGYAEYAFKAFLPMAMCYKNFIDPTVAPKYLSDERYKNILRWYYNILDPNEIHPTYDNTWMEQTGRILGILADEEFAGSSSVPDEMPDLRGDYLLAQGCTVKGEAVASTFKWQPLYLNPESGNLRQSMEDKNGSKHTYYQLFEYDHAVDNDANSYFGEGGHEDFDMASFSIRGDRDELALDAPYMGWGEQASTNHHMAHNTIQFYNFNNVFNPVALPIAKNYVNTPSLMHSEILYELPGGPYLKREVKMINSPAGVYYLLNDRVNNGQTVPENKWIKMNMHGNGHSEELSFSLYERLAFWKNPCMYKKDLGGTPIGQWDLLQHISVLNGTANPPTLSFDQGAHTKHNNSPKAHDGVTNTSHIGLTRVDGSLNYGEHTALRVEQDETQSLFQSFLLPVACNKTHPHITKIENTDFVSTLIRFIEPIDTNLAFPQMYKTNVPNSADTIRELHIGRMSNDVTSLTNIFNTTGPDSVSLESDAMGVYYSKSTYTKVNPGACVSSKVPFNKAGIDNGKLLRIDEIDYIRLNLNAYAHYEYVSKYRYKVTVNPLANPNVTVSLYLPDLEPGYDVKAINGFDLLPSTYDSDSFRINVLVSSAMTFMIELDNLCQADCFFPPTNEPINTFDIFETGDVQVLGHDLEVIQPDGNYHIIKGSKMSICSDFTFINNDSLFLYAKQTDEIYPYQNEMDGPVTTKRSVVERLKTTRSMIIVNDRAAIVLDSGSFTHVGDNSTILVLKGGTLLVRKGAILEIGGKEQAGKRAFGEVIAEEGAYVCIEDSSSIYFFTDTLSTDTFDNNIFYVSLNDYVPTIAGTNPEGGNGKFVDHDLTGPGRYLGSECIAFCDIKDVMPPHGIQNRDFGWCNFSEPVSRITVPEFVCVGQPITVKEQGVLNETWFKITVKDQGGHIVFSQTSNADTPRFVSRSLPPLDEIGSYEITLITKNDCGEGDTVVKYITVPGKPVASFTTSSNGCAGTGGVTANGSASTGNMNPMRHLWYVQRLDSVYHYGAWGLEPDDYTKEWEIDSLPGPDSNFTFPGFMWEGGYSYIVGLTVYDYCYDSTWYDTITIPLGVHITAKSLKSGSNYIGTYGVELKGVITSAYDSFAWYPPLLLNRTDTLCPVTTTLDSTAYVLTAYKDNCVARDTIIVKHREYVHLGENRVACMGDSIVAGNYLEASLIIGLVGYLNPGLWGPYFDDLEDNNTDFRKEFTRLLYHRDYQFMEELEACAVPFVQFLHDHRQDFYTKPHYARLYEQYLSAHHLSDYIDVFKNDFMNEYEDLDDLYRDHMDLNGGFNYYRGTLRTCVEDMIGNMIDVYSSASAVYTQWYVDHVESTADENLFMIGRQINQPTHFGLLVTNDGQAEYDETMIYTDTVIIPAFSIGMMIDSTVYFANHTENDHGNVTYLWVFGDGDSSTEVTPFHTYPKFDTTYVVCLYATNACGTFQVCDTLIVDSLHEAMYGFNKRSVNKGNSKDAEFGEGMSQGLSKLSHRNILGYNRPNPFSGITEIDYELKPDRVHAELLITNLLGQVVQQQALPNIKGTLLIDAQKLNSGMYYYSLVVDDVVAETRIMVVR